MGFEPYPFQAEDIAKLVRQKAGLIGSEMGTGKTHEAIALDEEWWEQGKGPTLVVAPLNTFTSWVNKYSMQSPSSDVTVIDRKNRDAFAEAVRRKRGDVFLMHWDALRLLPQLRNTQFNLIVADEVHRAANRKAVSTQSLKKLKTDHKLGMSGTAGGDKPEGLWSIVNWLWPRYYTSYWKFRQAYCIEDMVTTAGNPNGYRKIVGVQNIDLLMEQMAPWYVRHLKREQCCEHHPDGVMPWLKPKTYDTIWVDLNATQRKVYDQMHKNMVAWVGEHEDSPLVASIVVVQMARLSQIALATPVVSEEWHRRRNKESGELEGRLEEVVYLVEPSTKLDALVELLQDHPDKKFVVCTSSKKMAYLVHERIKEKYGSFVCSGDTPQSERDVMVERFQNDRTQVFIGVIAAMAEGIDGLQYATDTMVFLDRSWSAIKNQQCEDRLHRDGQDEAVNIIDIVAKNTLDWGRKQRLETKWSWIKTILGDIPAAQKAMMEEA